PPPQDVVGVLDLAAPRAGEVALEQRLELDYQRKLLAFREALADQVHPHPCALPHRPRHIPGSLDALAIAMNARTPACQLPVAGWPGGPAAQCGGHLAQRPRGANRSDRGCRPQQLVAGAVEDDSDDAERAPAHTLGEPQRLHVNGDRAALQECLALL